MPAAASSGSAPLGGSWRTVRVSTMGDTITERFVDSVDGVRIATYEQGNPDGPTLVMAHGWPDSHVLWDGVVSGLSDRFRIIRYDSRGVGNSSVPKPVSAYTISRLADDLGAVIAAAGPGARVHLLGHAWGSGGAWEHPGRPGADLGVSEPAGCRRPGGVLPLGVRAGHRPLRRLHLRQPQASLPARPVR